MRTVVRMSKNGAKEPAKKLKHGSNGFLLAEWSDGMEHESELPNSAIQPSQPMAKAPPRKRPAAALEPVPSAAVPASVETTTAAEATAAVAAAENPEQCEYKLEYRSSTNAVAIRKVVKVECGPPKKRQVVEIIGRDRLTREAVTSIATQARDRLLAGESEAHVVQWAKEQSKQ